MSSTPASAVVRLGLVGLNWGERVAMACTRVAGVQLAGCHARAAERRDAFAAQYGCRAHASFDAMIHDASLDGIVVMTPNATHRDLTVAALAAGKHVLVTKPIAANLEDARAMIETARTHRRLLVVGHQARRHAAVREMKRLLDRGMLGQPVVAEANVSSPTGPTHAHTWRESPDECPGGPLLQLGIHAIDTLQFLLSSVSEVTGLHRRLTGGSGPPDATHTLLRTSDGVVATLVSSYVTPWTRWLRISGTEAAAWYEGASGLWMARTRQAPEPVLPPTANEEIVNAAVAEEIAEFAECIRSGKPPEIDGGIGARNLAVVLASVESDRRKRVVPVAELWP